jgi:hypothetical protein
MKETKKTDVWWLFKLRWIFNSLMMSGAVLGCFIGFAAVHIQDTWRHQGPGIIWDERDEGEQVSANRFKRYHYGTTGLFLILGLGIWIRIAKNAKNEAVERAANKDYLDAKTETNAAYYAALAKVMGADAYQSAAAEAMKDPAYQAAKASEAAMNRVCYVASRAAKGDE